MVRNAKETDAQKLIFNAPPQVDIFTKIKNWFFYLILVQANKNYLNHPKWPLLSDNHFNSSAVTKY